jgi:uncharacterized protein (DUF2252 family)
MTDSPTFEQSWAAPPSVRARAADGRDTRRRVPRSTLSRLTVEDRDPLGILDRQNATRIAELVPLRTERMAASPFAFYRGTAALQAADLARDPHSGILVPSCGDAHVANFGFYASPQRTLVFDLNDFDEAAWAPWEWDVKRLVTSIVIGGQASSRDESVVTDAALAAVRTYARAMAANADRSPLLRYFEHFDVGAVASSADKQTRAVLQEAMRDAEKRTGDRATKRLTETGPDGRLVFVEQPPTMVHADAATESRLRENVDRYARTASVDIRLLLTNYTVSDLARRVVGVGSVGTMCTLALFQDGEGNALILQAKEAGRSVLEEYGGIAQPAAFHEHVEQYGQGGRVVALQRILQAVSDPFLGHLQAFQGDFYVRQFHDMKGGIDAEELEDRPFRAYAESCAATLARAHSQSANAAVVAGYIGNGRVVGEALLEWAYAYAALSHDDYDAFVAAETVGP